MKCTHRSPWFSANGKGEVRTKGQGVYIVTEGTLTVFLKGNQKVAKWSNGLKYSKLK